MKVVQDGVGFPTLEPSFSKFPDGQSHVAMETTQFPVTITASICNPDDLFNLLLVKDTLDRNGCPRVNLKISYLMGGRMDRPMPGVGNLKFPFTLRVVTNLINAAGFGSIELFDPHSDVSVALLDAKVKDCFSQVGRIVLENKGRFTLVAPDAGAAKKVAKLSDKLKLPMVQATKRRDEATGQLSFPSLIDPNGDIPGKIALIVDDICDGGRTFVNLAREIRRHNPLSIWLYVSHGIFSNGLPLDGIDRIFTTDSRLEIFSELAKRDYSKLVTVYNL